MCGRYPKLLGLKARREVLKCVEPIPLVPRYCCTWRGGGFNDDHKSFFELGKSYRVPGFLATSLELNTAMKFIRRANRAYPRVLWCILVRLLTALYCPECIHLESRDSLPRLCISQLDGRGAMMKEHRCKNANFVLKTEFESEMEFLYAPYSVFKARYL